MNRLCCRPSNRLSYRFINGIIAGLIFLLSPQALAQSSTPHGRCYVDGEGAPFEAITGYQLRVARDGSFFTESERRALNLIAGMLPKSLLRLPSLNYLERVADGYSLEGGAVGMYKGRRIWGSGINQVGGRIYLTQGNTLTRNGRFWGEFYETVIHEIAHALDFQLNDISTQASWKDLSIWNTEQEGISPNFVTSYARSSPPEDFAESVAAYLLEADQLLRVAPQKFEWIAQFVFQGKRYDTHTLWDEYRRQLESLTGEGRSAKLRELRASDYYACSILENVQ